MRAKLASASVTRLPSKPDALLHFTHVPFPPLIRISQRSNPASLVAAALGTSARTNPPSRLPLPYTTITCVRPDGIGTLRVCMVDPDARGNCVTVMALPFNVFCGAALSSLGAATKACSSGAYHRQTEPPAWWEYRISFGGTRSWASSDIAVRSAVASVDVPSRPQCWTARRGVPADQCSPYPISLSFTWRTGALVLASLF